MDTRSDIKRTEDSREPEGEVAVRPSFVLRLWMESGPAGEPVWRWHIQHVQSGAHAYAGDIASIIRFVESKAGCTGPD